MTKNEQTFSKTLDVDGMQYRYFPVSAIEGTEKLPRALVVLVENVLRNAKDASEAYAQAARIIEAGLAGKVGDEVEFNPARVLFQDFTGVPVFTDFAVMREACEALGGDAEKINPRTPCDLVIDHSVIADEAGCAGALAANMELEFTRNRERYNFLKWAQKSFRNVRIVPPGKGICHQLNIETFAPVVFVKDDKDAVRGAGVQTPGAQSGGAQTTGVQISGAQTAGAQGEAAQTAGAQGEAAQTAGVQNTPLVYFDTLVGTDSHTPTANGIGVLGWGVGGIEAEAAALGQPITTLVPRVIGVHLTGKLASGVAAMDVALTFAQTLRAKGVVGCFVECFGEGVAGLSATERACISNMTPEYGSTCTLFPIDERTLEYLSLTGRSVEQVALVEAYAKAQGVWESEIVSNRVYADVIEIDLSQIKPSISGPARPHDRMDITGAQTRFRALCSERKLDLKKRVSVDIDGQTCEITHGAIAIAAVTSCTTATDPAMMLACGLVARNAVARGLRVAPWVKTILAPGSHATELLLERAGLLKPLSELGFHTCGFGCMSCIGNSGPIAQSLHEVAGELELASVLSGNRNFEGRISADVSQNYLAAPAMVVAYALAGTIDIDLARDALGTDVQGAPVYLSDIWPDESEISTLVEHYVTSDLYKQGTRELYTGDASWESLDASASNTFAWDESSTYVRRPPYFDGMTKEVCVAAPVKDARVLALLGDFITTDHISPAGAIAPASPAARYLREHGIAAADFNTYGARRGNHEVMMRGTFANVKLQNMLAAGKKGGWTYDFLAEEIRPLFDAAQNYHDAGIQTIVVAGKMYGSGSSRDWAAKGPMLLGVRAVIAESFERIHRSNLIGMGILPLQFLEGESANTLGLDGTETYSVEAIDFSAGKPCPQVASVKAVRADGSVIDFKARVRIDTPTEGHYFANGGILPFVLRNLA